MKTSLGQQIAGICGSSKLLQATGWLAKSALPIALPALLLAGCSTFNRDWKTTVQQAAPADSIEGRWEGQWLSDVNGHKGRLRCLLSRESDSRFQARFRATYWKIFRYGYSVAFQFEHRDSAWHFTGAEDLGKLAGGIYHYDGRATPTNFFSTYRSKHDRGTFQMRRPK